MAVSVLLRKEGISDKELATMKEKIVMAQEKTKVQEERAKYIKENMDKNCPEGRWSVLIFSSDDDVGMWFSYYSKDYARLAFEGKTYYIWKQHSIDVYGR